MQYLQRLEPGDKIFIIDDKNEIKEIVLWSDHLKEDQVDRYAIFRDYQLKSDIVESGGYVKLEKVVIHEEIDRGLRHKSAEYVITDKVAYLSFEEAQSHLNDLIYQRDTMNELQSDVNHELEPHLSAVKQILSNYFDRIDRHDIEESLLESEDHQNLVKLRDSIDF